MNEREKEKWFELELRKVEALERIDNSLNVLVGIKGYTWNMLKDIVLQLSEK